MTTDAPTAVRQQIPAIRVRGGLPFLARQRLLAAGAWVRGDGRDEVVVGVSVAEFEKATGLQVMETAVCGLMEWPLCFWISNRVIGIFPYWLGFSCRGRFTDCGFVKIMRVGKR